MAASADIYTPAAYEPRAMDSLVDIDLVSGIFADRNGYETMSSLIRDIFLKHGMENNFGVGLLHKHYPLASNERIVELGPVSSPWVIGDSDDIAGGSVFAHTWRVYKGEIRPVEYCFVPQSQVASANKAVFPAAFARDIIQILELTGLDDVLSLTLLDRSERGSDSMELTYGRSSIVIPTTKDEEGKILNDHNIEGFRASWAFTNESVQALHTICGKSASDGVQTLHTICGKSASDGVQALHTICGKSASDGVQALHTVCGKSASNGVQALHTVCGKSASNGVQALHTICGKSASDGVQALHTICGKSASDGVQALHTVCGKSASDGVQALHTICGKSASNGVQALHTICGKSASNGVQALHTICGKSASDGVRTLHTICGKSASHEV